MRRMRIRLVLTAALVFLLFILFSPHSPASALTWTVDDSFASDNVGTRQMTTIQKAIDNASAGDVIVINTGVYPENVMVNKTLSIQGNPRNTTFVNPPLGGIAFQVQANNVNISALTINVTSWGIYVSSSYQRLNVNSVTFEGLEIGVYVDGAANVTAEANYVGNLSDSGIYAGYSYNTQFKNNTIFRSFRGAYYLYTDAGVIRDGNQTAGTVGVTLIATSSTTVDRNHIGNFTGQNFSYAYGVDAQYDSRSTVSSNRIDNVSGYGIRIYYSYDLSVKANDFSDDTYPILIEPREATDRQYFNHSILSTNSVDGKSVYYYVNATSVTVPSGAGWVGAFNVTGLTVPFQNITRASFGIWLNRVTNATLSGLNVTNSTPNSLTYAVFLANTVNVTILGLNVTGDLGALYGYNATNTTVENGTIRAASLWYYYAMSIQSSDGLTIRNNTFNPSYYSPYYVYFTTRVRILGNTFNHSGGAYLQYTDAPLIQNNQFNDSSYMIYGWASQYGRVYNNTATNSSYLIYIDGYLMSHFQWDIAANNTWEGRVARSYLNVSNITLAANLSFVLLANVSIATASYYDPINSTIAAAVIAYSNNITFNRIIANFSSYGIWVTGSQNVTLRNYTVNGTSYGSYVYSSTDVVLTNVTFRDIYYVGIYAAYSSRLSLVNSTFTGLSAYAVVTAYSCDRVTLDNATATRSGRLGEFYYSTRVSINRGNLSSRDPFAGDVVGVYAYNVSWLDVTNTSLTDVDVGVRLTWATWNVYIANLSTNNVTGDGIEAIADSNVTSGNLTVVGGRLQGRTSFSPDQDGVKIENLVGPVLVMNLNISRFATGISLDPLSNATVTGNSINNTTVGISLLSVADSTVSGNTVTDTTNSAISLNGVSNTTLTTNTITRPGSYALALIGSTRLTVTSNTIQGGIYGIFARGGRDSLFSSNSVNGTTDTGIFVLSSHENSTFNSNTITNSLYGFYINSVSFLTLDSNAMSGSTYNFRIEAFSLSRFYHRINSTNTVNSKPIYYLVNQSGGTVPTTAGVAILANCTGTLVSGLTVDHNWHGVLLFQSSGITVLSITVGTTRYGIEARLLVNSTIQDSVVDGAEIGIQITQSSINNTLLNNRVNGSTLYGLYVISSSRNTLTNNSVNASSNFGLLLQLADANNVTNNRITNNSYIGLWMSDCSGNVFYGNQLDNNTYAWQWAGSTLSRYNHTLPPNNTIDGKPIFYRINTTGVSVPADSSMVILANVTNATISGLVINRTYDGIHLFSSRFINISNVSFLSGNNGIQALRTQDVTVRNVSTNSSFTTYQVVYFRELSSNLSVSDSTLPFAFAAVYAQDAFNITVTNSTMGLPTCCIYVYYPLEAIGRVDNATFSGNTFLRVLYGLYANGFNAGEKVSNITFANNSYGAYSFNPVYYGSSFAENITFYHNNFNLSLNQNSPYDPDRITSWYRAYPWGGNFWSNYTSPDTKSGANQDIAGGDGIVDFPFNYTYLSDRYPLVDPWPPRVRLVTPANGSAVRPGRALDFNVSLYFDSATYAIDNGTNTSFSSPFDVNTTGWSDGAYHIWVNATDATGTSDSKWFVFAIDSVAPTISAVSPSPGGIYFPGILLNFTILDPHLALNATWNNGSGNVSFATIWNISTTGWADGDYNITVTAWDTAGNRGQATFMYGLDAFAPSIVLGTPGNNSVIPAGTTIDLNIIEPHFANASWNNGSGANAFTAPFDINTAGWPDGPVNLTVFANDTTGKQAYALFRFTIDSTPPTITLNAPANGSVIRAGTTIDLSVSDTNLNTVTWNNGSGAVTIGSPYDISTSAWPDGPTNVTVIATDLAGNTRTSAFYFEFDSTPPTISALSPSNNSVVTVGTVLDFQITDAHTFNASWNNGSASNALSSPYDIPTTGWAEGTWTVTINATDVAGNTRFLSFRVTLDSTPPSITLNSPANNSVIAAGTSIDLSVSDANLNVVNWTTGGAPTPLSSPYDISTSGWADGVYTVRVNATDLAGNLRSVTYNFTIDSTPPTITLNTPANNSVVVAGTIIDLSVTDANLNFANWTTGGTPTAFSSPYDINTSGWSDGVYTLRVNATDLAGNLRLATYSFTIDSTPPTITLNSPANNSVVVAGTIIDLSVTDANLNYANWTTGGSPTTLSSPYDINTSGWADGLYTVRVNATDLAGNLRLATYSFTIDSTPPTITLNSPLNNSVVVAGTTIDISVTDANLNYANWTTGGSPTTFSSPYDISTSGWSDGLYAVRVNATDLAGNLRSATYSFTIDSTPPTITLNSPANQSVIRAGTLIDLTVSDANLNFVNWTASGSPSPLSSPYDINTSGWADGVYTVRVNATDFAGNLRTVSYQFTIDSTPPTVTYLGPPTVALWNSSYVIRAGAALNFGVTDANLNASFVSNGTANVSLISPFSVNTSSWTAGAYYNVTVSALDRAGNIGSRSIRVFIDSGAPAVTFRSPGNDTYGVAGTLLEFEVIEETLLSLNWSNGGSVNSFALLANNMTGAIAGTLYYVNTSGWADGTYTIRINASDAAGYAVSSASVFHVDSTPPVISLLAPANNSVIEPGTTIVLSIVEVNLANATWSNDSINRSFATPFNISTAGWADGPYNVTARVTDRANTTRVRLYRFVIDSTYPVIPVPAWNGTAVDPGTLLNLTVVEANLQSLEYDNLAGSSAVVNASSIMINTSGWADADYSIQVRALDRAGHWTNVTFAVTLDSIFPVFSGVTPANGSFVRPGVPISFSASDTNLQNVTWQRGSGATLPANGTGPYSINTSTWGNGNWTIRLFARDRAGHQTTVVTQLVTDSLPPVLPFLAPSQSYDEDVMVTFNASAANDGPNPLEPSSFEWDFSGRLNALLSGPVVTYTWDTPGDYSVTLTVTDRAGNANNTTFAVRVRDITPPIAVLPGDFGIDEDVAVYFDPSSSSDNDPSWPQTLQYAWNVTNVRMGQKVSFPGCLSNQFPDLGCASGDFNLSGKGVRITFFTPGPWLVELRVTDAAGLSDIATVRVDVRDVTPPSIPPFVFPLYNEGATVEFNASGTVDNDPANTTNITYRWTFTGGAPTAELATFAGNRTFVQPGTYTVTLTATDAHGNAASRSTPLRINDVPSLASMPSTSVELPATYEGVLDILDTDAGDTHNVTVASPTGMTVGTAGGKPVLRFTPSAFGIYFVSFTLSDGWSIVSFAFNLTVTTSPVGNQPPYFTSEPILAALAGSQYIYNAHATDPDGDRLLFGLDVAPPLMEVDKDTGTVSWSHGYLPTSGDHRDNVSLWVWDGAHRVYQTYTIRFIATGNSAPSIGDGVLGTVTLKNGSSFEIEVGPFVTDSNDPVSSLIFNVSSVNLAVATATIQGSGSLAKILVTGVSEGSTTLVLRVRDESGGTATKSIQVTVEPVGGTAPPPGGGIEGLLLPLALGGVASGGGIAFFVITKGRRRREEEAGAAATAAPAAAEVVPVQVGRVHAAPEAVSVMEAPAEVPLAVVAAAPAEKKLTYVIEGLFVIYKDGRLLYSKTDMGQQKFEDPELVSSMFTAVQSFIKDSFAAEGELNKMGYGDNQIIIERGRHVFMAAIVYGEPDQEFTDAMKGAIENIELSYAGVIEKWDGMMDAFADMEAKVASIVALTAGVSRREVELATTKEEVKMLSELEFFQGFVRLKVGIKNNTRMVITKATVDIEYNEDVLRLARVEPAAYKTSGAKVLLGVLNPGEKSSVAYYFDPQICTESQIDGVCRYRDASGVLHTVSMKTRKAEVVCPLFFTKEHANTAMLKRLIESELGEKDSKVFEILKMPPYIKHKDVFDLVKSVVAAHDVHQVREFTKFNPFQGEAWYYGETKVKGYKIVIRASVIEETKSMEFFAASTNMKAITGLLAEFNHTLNSMVIEKYSDLKIALTFDSDKKAELEKRALMTKMSEADLEGGETEQR